MLGFFLFLAVLSFIISYVVYGVYLATLYENKEPYKENGQLRDDKKLMLGASIFCISFSIIFLLLITLISSSVGMQDFWLALLLFVLISYITSLLTARRQKNKQKQNNFKRINRNSLILLVTLFIFFGVTDDSIETSSSESTAGEKVENIEAVDDEVTQEDSDDEQERQRELEEKEKEEAEALAAKEKAEREQKEKEEQLAKEKAQKAEKEKAEKEEQERLAAEKKAKEQEEKKRLEEEKAEKEASKEGLIPVTLYRVVDGDTVNVLNEQNEELKLRLLLIDTPETVHPNKPVEPFGPEASARLTELLNSDEQLYIEYDEGAKTDHYDRELVYLYVGDTNVHEVLLEEGLARVGYIYEQQKYLDEFRAAEQIAKDQQIGIWSISGYVNEDGEGFNSESKEEIVSEPAIESSPSYSESTTNNATTAPPAETGGGQFFNNCDELRTVYPEGVSSSDPAYQLKMDRDKDGWACEI
ncbi:thermonuclease family protein [Jeotgalicoccus sp. S0W5]|uniref:thermonuclease family protein n=1 Tax=Jeotgalicoccus sp. S0W5 TaxID=2527874 RepID=UPI00141500C0|nr:thermonuclease family protein [Jeotgalicoccus sp. S0W5]